MSPPPWPSEATLTAPVAQEYAAPCAQTDNCVGVVLLPMMPWFDPTSPPALESELELGCGVPLALALTTPKPWESVMLEPAALLPTRPPTARPKPVPFTLPLA